MAERFFDQFPPEMPVTIEVHRKDFENPVRTINTTAEFGAKTVRWYSQRRLTREIIIQVPEFPMVSVRGPAR